MDQGLKIKFVQRHPQFAYFAGDEAALPEKIARMLIAGGFAELAEAAKEAEAPKARKPKVIKK